MARDAQAGDAVAYSALFARVQERLLTYVDCRLGPELRARLDVHDVLQEVSLRAHRAFPRFSPRGPGAFTGWIFRIAENTIRDLVDYHRAHRRRPAEGLIAAASACDRSPAEQAGPATASEVSEDRARLRAAIDALDPAQREALLLRHFHGATLEQIAVRLKVSERSVRRLLARAQVRLGGLLEEGGGLPGSP